LLCNFKQARVCFYLLLAYSLRCPLADHQMSCFVTIICHVIRGHMQAGDLGARFKPYSKFPPCYKDMAFWVSPEFTENNLCELVRALAACWVLWWPHCGHSLAALCQARK
jgi:hypothetical protein